jgi:uncharacterized protein YbbC (DUF1343 family)
MGIIVFLPTVKIGLITIVLLVNKEIYKVNPNSFKFISIAAATTKQLVEKVISNLCLSKHVAYSTSLKVSILFAFFLLQFNSVAQTKKPYKLRVGAECSKKYINLIKGKKVAVLANQSSLIAGRHLVDSLLKLQINVKKVFCPEHGFRGDADAGEHVKNYKDAKTHLPVISLYGNSKKPQVKDLKGIEYIIFDLQDVGARFYTYISTLHYVMEACAENDIRLIVLDRPNPNGFYVDGPVREEAFKSFVGMDPIPVVHGLTVGEYAKMANGEGWLANGKICLLTVIPCENYSHSDFYSLPIKPSPNLPNMQSIYLYPSLCFFEGANVSLGRGTDKPFQQIGYPTLTGSDYSFTPVSIPGASKNPPFKDQKCFGYDFSEYGETMVKVEKKINLFWLIETYKTYPEKEKFFTNYFNTLAGNATLKQQIMEGRSEADIRKSWEPALSDYKRMRKRYLLYRDFE